jgi:transcription initiation factor TFIIIB Brf1 subunit/transcription initiation factor TFIIB
MKPLPTTIYLMLSVYLLECTIFEIEKQISAGKKPMGLAATVLYLSCLKTGEDTTQIQMADAAGVTEVTVRNLLRELKTKLKP